MTAPYYSDDLVTLHCGSCLEITSWASADVLVTDPPYGLAADLTTKTAAPAWDRDLEVRDAALALFLSGGARGDEFTRPYAVFASPRRPDTGLPFRQAPLVWDKGEGVGIGDTTFPWRPSYELIYVSGAGWAGHRGPSVLRVPQPSRAATELAHPTPKPVALMRMLLEKAPPGVVADPFAGTGPTLIAAKQLGRRAVGVELDPKHCQTAARRLAQDVLDLEDEPAAPRFLLASPWTEQPEFDLGDLS